MAELLLAWFSVYGLPLMLGALVFGQIGIPVPTSILLLTVGAMLSDSVYAPWAVFAMGLIGAVIGDQISYWIGRIGGHGAIERLRSGRYRELVERAERYSERFGARSVFLSRWLVSPIGPYLNYVVGMTGLQWGRFTVMSIAGEALWIAIFLTLGHLFSRSIAALDDLLANSMWFIGALIAAIVLGRPVMRTWHKIGARLAERRRSRKSTL